VISIYYLQFVLCSRDLRHILRLITQHANVFFILIYTHFKHVLRQYLALSHRT